IIMSVLIFIDHAEGQIKKASLEAISYGVKIAQQNGSTAEGVVLGNITEDLAALGKYGVQKIHHAADAVLDHLDAQLYTAAIAQLTQYIHADVIIFSNNTTGKAIAPRLSAK